MATPRRPQQNSKCSMIWVEPKIRSSNVWRLIFEIEGLCHIPGNALVDCKIATVLYSYSTVNVCNIVREVASELFHQRTKDEHCIIMHGYARRKHTQWNEWNELTLKANLTSLRIVRKQRSINHKFLGISQTLHKDAWIGSTWGDLRAFSDPDALYTLRRDWAVGISDSNSRMPRIALLWSADTCFTLCQCKWTAKWLAWCAFAALWPGCALWFKSPAERGLK